MGQCSPLPANRSKHGMRSSMTSSQSSHYSREQREACNYRADDSRRQMDVDEHGTRDAHTNRKYEQYMDDGASGSYHTAGSSKSMKRRSKDPISDMNHDEYFPPPPEGALRTRCYRLNLEVPDGLSPTHDLLGPFVYQTPSHLMPRATVSFDDDDDFEEEKSATQIAIETASIFRGISVDSRGNIVGRNERSSRNRGKTQSTAENSRQSAKIDKANDLVDELAGGFGNENNGSKANMMSIVPIGDYDDLKQMVRDGSKKLRENEGLGDEHLLVFNHSRARSIYNTSHFSPSTPNVSRKMSNDQSSILSYQSSMSKSGLKTNIGRDSIKMIPPNPRDHISSRKGPFSSDHRNGVQSDWSESFNFNAFWNCGATGKTSPVSIHPDIYTDRRTRMEGRNESIRFSRGGGMSERDAPMSH